MTVANIDTQTEALWLSWQHIQAQTDVAIQEGTAHYFKCIRQTACDAFALEALATSRLGQNDERVFNHLVRLMETYREVISLFDSPIKDTSPDLVAGLCDILSSRLGQFEDDLTGQENPVAKEKQAILEKAIISMASHIESLETITPTQPIGAASCYPPSESNPQYQPILEKILPSLQFHYAQTLQTCLASIDDLHTRKTAAYYTDLLEREWEVLGPIIQVQVKAIEAAFEAAENKDEDIHPILSKLREAYQQTGPVVSGLRKMMQPVNSARPNLNTACEGFTKALTAITAPPINIDSQNFTAALLPKADEIFEGLRTNHLEELSDIQIEINDQISLANDVVSIFEKAEEGLAALKQDALATQEAVLQEDAPADAAPAAECANTDDIPALPEASIPAEIPCAEASVIVADVPAIEALCVDKNTPAESIETPDTTPPNHTIDNEILNGIVETISIKVESLAESLQQFIENTTNLLASLPKGLPMLTEENLTSAASQLQAAWFTNPPTLETIADFFADSTTLEAFATYNEQFAKHITNSSARVEKVSFRFKKETLLYEISTYEEILYHSVSRLRESQVPHITTAVNLLDETFLSLKTLLTESGITIIRPTAHEPFNGREHEVLIAEETEGFAKGEIVKVMTSGYKYKDQVILRANVIAAR